MTQTVFYSWQSDRPTKQGRNLIQKALEIAVKAISTNVQVEEALRGELMLDRDTQGVPGSPPVFQTILDKIEKASVFVADLTFCGLRYDGKRQSPNPNVLIEYGCALKSVGYRQIISVMNAAHGEPSRESLPFNLADLRFPLTYNLPDNASDELRRTEREKLAKNLERALRDIFQSDEFKVLKAAAPTPFIPVISKDGPARFRGPEEPLGFMRDSFSQRIGQPETAPIYLVRGPALWLRLMPSADLGRKWRNVELKRPTLSLATLPLMQNAGTDIGLLEADDGCGSWRVSRADQTYAVAYAFRSGELWLVNSMMSRVTEFFELDEDGWARTLEGCASFLISIGCKKPYRWIVGFEGIRGRKLAVRGRALGQCVGNLVEATGIYAENDKASQLLLEFFEDVYDGCGRQRPESAPL